MSKVRLVQICALIFVTFSLSGCFLMLPFVEPDSTALQGGIPQQSARARQFYPSRGKHSGSARSASLQRLALQLQRGAPVERVNAASRVGELGSRGRQFEPYLISNLTHSDKWVRRSNAKALGKLKSRPAVPALIQLLGDNNKWVAHSAAGALRQIGTPQAIAGVQRYKGI